MQLTPPVQEIRLYHDGFEASGDALHRSKTGQSLSDLVERVSDPMVIALDGGWGSGKTFFLQCWVGEHLKRDTPRAQTVYFDAFAHDFIDEPLVSLMGVIAERLDDTDRGPRGVTSAVNMLKRAALPLTRVALAAATYGATEAGGALLRAITEKTGDELDKAATDFWKHESGTRAAMNEFRKALITLTEPHITGDEPQKLVIVIDELDRCRPDYALSLLEIIKHFFAVPHVHFVLGVNLIQLENSVRTRYGAGIDAGLYLQKFVTATMRLPETSTNAHTPCHTVTYFEQIADKMGFGRHTISLFLPLIPAFRETKYVTLRGMQRLLTSLHFARLNFNNHSLDSEKIETVIACLAMLKAWELPLYHKIRSGAVEMSDVEKAFTMVKDPMYGDVDLYFSWLWYLDPEKYATIATDSRDRATPTKEAKKQELQRLIQTHLEVFNLPAPS